MIHLDTNLLIALTSVHARGRARLRTWLEHGEQLATRAIAWSEYLNGPVSNSEIQDAMQMLQGRIVPVAAAEA